MTTSLKPIEYTVHSICDADYTIDYNEALNVKAEAEMSFSERLAMQIEQADTKVTMNTMHKKFDWDVYAYVKN